MEVADLDESSQEVPMSMDADAWVPGQSGGDGDTQDQHPIPAISEVSAGEISEVPDSLEVQEAVKQIKPGMVWDPGAWKGKGKRPSLILLKREVVARDGTRKPAQWTFERSIQWLLAHEPLPSSGRASPCASEACSLPTPGEATSISKPAQRIHDHLLETSTTILVLRIGSPLPPHKDILGIGTSRRSRYPI